LTKAIAAHKTPADIIAEMVQREIAATDDQAAMAVHSTGLGYSEQAGTGALRQTSPIFLRQIDT
jgi:hypothetical protein